MDILIERIEGSLWAAAIEDSSLRGVEVDPVLEGVRWGAVYWARVTKLDKRMNAAFLDLGHGEQGLLNAKDFRKIGKEGIGKKISGEITKELNPGDMILVQAKSSTLPEDLHDDFMVSEHKIARVSMDIAIPGRYLIYTPVDENRRVSSRVKDKTLRKRMLSMLDKVEEVGGCILRSSAANVQTDVLMRESKLLKQIWTQLEGFKRGEAPSLIMEGPDSVQRLISDMAHAPLESIIVIDEDIFEEVEEWCDLYATDLVPKIKFMPLEDNEGSASLLDRYDMTSEVESLIQPYFVLPSGGNIIIQETNALTAIDVNLSMSKSHYETNLEAAREVMRQLRLRNIGGVVMVDFINTTQKKQKEEILSILKDEALKDPCRVDVHDFTALGFVEMSRARRTPPLDLIMQITMAVHESQQI